MPLRDTDYMYSSARIRAAEGSVSPREKIERMLESKSAGEIYAELNGGEASETPENIGINEIDKAAEDHIARAARLVLSVAPEPELLKFLLFPYDCTNIKTALKCNIRGIDAGGMMYDFASVPESEILNAVHSREFGILPEKMAEACTEALEKYSETSDPRTIDLVIDRACFADMSAGAEKTKCGFLIEYAHAKADVTNLLIFDRVSGMNEHIRGSLLESALVMGGEIPEESFRAEAENGRGGIRNIVSSTRYSSLSEVFTDDASSADIEKKCEDFITAPVSGIKYKPFGIEILAAYFITSEYEAKNSRIIAADIISGRKRGQSVREAVRTAYV